MKKRAHVIFSGTVQGVGFRWTAKRTASPLDLTGWVRNCPDGTVETLIEGSEKQILSFIESMKVSMNFYIKNAALEWLKYRGEFPDFEIRF